MKNRGALNRVMLLLLICASLFISSCYLQKRHYRSGYYVEFHSQNSIAVQDKTVTHTTKPKTDTTGNAELNLNKKSPINEKQETSVASLSYIPFIDNTKIKFDNAPDTIYAEPSNNELNYYPQENPAPSPDESSDNNKEWWWLLAGGLALLLSVLLIILTGSNFWFLLAAGLLIFVGAAVIISIIFSIKKIRQLRAKGPEEEKLRYLLPAFVILLNLILLVLAARFADTYFIYYLYMLF